MKLASLRPYLPRPAFRRRFNPSRQYAFNSAPASLQVFNDTVKKLQRERSASSPESSRAVDYLRDEVASRLSERLLVLLFPSLPNPPPLLPNKP